MRGLGAPRRLFLPARAERRLVLPMRRFAAAEPHPHPRSAALLANYVEQRASAGRALSAADAARLAAAHRAKALLLASLRLRWRAAAHDPDAAAAGDLALGRLDMSEEAVAALTAPSLWVSCSEVGLSLIHI